MPLTRPTCSPWTITAATSCPIRCAITGASLNGGRIDPNAAFGDLVQAQQTLVADVTAYLGILGSLWTSVVGVADFLQTDDLFQLGKPMELPGTARSRGAARLAVPPP